MPAGGKPDVAGGADREAEKERHQADVDAVHHGLVRLLQVVQDPTEVQGLEVAAGQKPMPSASVASW
jgi:hypothetical protein